MPITQLGSKLWQIPHVSGETVILGSNKGSFEPNLSLNCFRGKGNLKFLPQVLALSAESQGDQLVARNSNYNFIWKPTGINSLFNERGGMDIVITLYKKPPRNYFDFGYDSDVLIPYHQPELTAQEIAEGCFRPEYVINSIAWYHKTKGGLVTPSDVNDFITTGKAFHTYNWIYVDAVGTKRITAMTLESGNVVRVHFDFTGMVFPVVISPYGDTFGLLTNGATTSSSANIRASKFAATGDGTATSLSFCAYVEPAVNGAGAIYNDNAGTPSSKRAEDSGNVVLPTLTPAAGSWPSVNISCSVTNTTPYWLALWGSDICSFKYDTGDSNQTNIFTGTFETWPDPYTSGTFYSRKFSIYCTFTPSGGGWTGIAKVDGVGQATLLKFKGVPKANIAKIMGVAV